MDWKLTSIGAAVALSLAMPAVQPVQAQDFLDGLGRGLGEGMARCLMGGCAAPQQQTAPAQTRQSSSTQRRAASSGPTAAERAQAAAQRQQNVDVQSALNGFGFEVGTADGDLGPRSRAAIADYQAYMGYPASGYLDDNQRGVLLNSHRRLQQGEGADYPQVVAAEGKRGLLRAFNDPQYADRYDVPQTPVPSTPVPVPPVQTAEVPHGGGVVDAPPATLPILEPTGEPSLSMADRCKFVELTTRTNQGPIQVSNMSDPGQALSEQFCEARSYAISVGQSRSAAFRASEDQLASSCQMISTAMAPVRVALTGDAPEAVATRASAVNTQIGLRDAANAAAYGQICLGLGYRTDDPEMALSAGLLLVGAGLAPAGEMVGHHLREGFGVGEDGAAALPWYQAALAALDGNAPPVILPAKTGERAAVIRAAIESGQIRADSAGIPALVPASAPLPGGQVISQ